MLRPSFRLPPLVGLLLATALLAAGARAQQPAMGVEQIERGMRGYGLSVFEGGTIEPFPVRVVSVMHRFGPKRAVIWIRCTGDRMRRNGPVSGMSGSPIYLWPKGQEKSLGKGGRLVGAFAYGYPFSKGAYVGVQPIAQMRPVAERAGPARTAGAGTGGRAVEALAARARSRLSRRGVFRLDALAQIEATWSDGAAPEQEHAEAAVPAPRGGGRVEPMRLPVTVPDRSTADLLAPVLERMGLRPLTGSAGGLPPGVEADSLALEPGAVMSVPLAFGDLDVAAAGTVTDTLPDGRVMGFGHAMFGQGTTALPVATGAVHTVIPSLASSFKLSSTAEVKGTLVQDETTAVVSRPGRDFETAPVSVAVRRGDETASYAYEVVEHPQLTPALAAGLANASVRAQRRLPPENTMRIRGAMRFEGGRSLALDTTVAGASGMSLMAELAPPMMLLERNPFRSVSLAELELEITVESRMRMATLVGASTHRSRLAPGETVAVDAMLKSYDGRRHRQRLELELPENLPPGEYGILVSGAARYVRTLLGSRPHLQQIETVDQLLDLIRRIYRAPRDAVFAVLLLPEKGVALGPRALPDLPSSHRAMLRRPNRSRATLFRPWLETRKPHDGVVTGHRTVQIRVRESPSE